jgi:SpoVK/Ycf46/Vps4 family AAA+-type ATPase
MTGFGRDAFTEAERQAAMGWQTTLVTPDGGSWLLNPGGPWLRWAGPNGWLPSPPPADPGMRFGARTASTQPPHAHEAQHFQQQTQRPPMPAPGQTHTVPQTPPRPVPQTPAQPMPPMPQPPPSSGPYSLPGVSQALFSTGPVPPQPFQQPAPQQPPPQQHVAAPGPAPVSRPGAAAPPGAAPMALPQLESVKIDGNVRAFVSVGESAWGFLDRVVRVVKWTAEARTDPHRENQANPIIVLVGEPHSGQRMFAEAMREALFDAKAIPANRLVFDTGSRVLTLTEADDAGGKIYDLFAEFGVKGKKVYLLREADDVIATEEGLASLCGILPRIATNRDAVGVFVLAGTQAFLDTVKANTSAAISDNFVYHLPSFAQPAVRGALLDVLAAEGGAVLTPAARGQLIDYTGACHAAGTITGGDAVVSAMDMATRAAVVRGSLGYDGRVVVDAPDLTELVPPKARGADEKSTAELLAELDGMIGLAPVKQRVRSLLDELAVDERRRAGGMKIATRSRHLVFTGNPGTAKTTVARLIARIYRSVGLLASGHVVEVQRADLVAEYIGQTAPKTRAVCEKAMGGVLFIDEAYELAPRNDDDYGSEAIAELLTQMENHRDELIVIAAGYPKQMDDFLDANPGMRSRFANRVEFPDYSNEELARIFQAMAEGEGYQLAEDLVAALPARMGRIGRGSGFANGRSARILLEATLSAQSSRLAGSTDDAALNQLVLADLPGPGGGGVGQTDDAGPHRGLTELMAELDGMIGLAAVKQQVKSIAAEIRVDARRRAAGLKVAAHSRHLVFTGNPGTAKTTVARLIAQIYRELGVLSSGHLIESGRPDFVAGYIGQTAEKTRKLCEKAFGGVLFVDEAYELAPVSEHDFGQEAIAELLVQMENHRDDLVVIAAGYPKDMDRFLDANAGLRSRFGTTINFPDYTNEELADIFRSMLAGQGYQASPELAAALPAVIAKIDRGKGFANGRSVRGLVEQMTGLQSLRLAGPDVNIDTLPTEQLTMLTIADLPPAYAQP